jgi:hypothetical protein
VLRILSIPARCRLVQCDVGGTRDVRTSIERAGRSIVATRRQAGVLAFGSDANVRSTFGTFTIQAFDVHTIHARLLPYEPAERELLYDALARALARERPLIDHHHRRGHTLTCDLASADASCLDGLRSVIGSIGGVVPGTTIRWSEAVRVKFSCDREEVRAVLEPTIWFHPFDAALNSSAAADLAGMRTSNRGARRGQLLLDAWSRLLAGGTSRELRAFGITDGVDAAFEVAS